MDKTTLRFYIVLWWLCNVIKFVHVNFTSLDDAKALHTHLLKDYNKYVRPVKDQSMPVDVHLMMTIISLQEFNEVLERFSVAGGFSLYWVDESMVWDENDYNNITSVFMGYKEMWVPELILTNPSQELDSYGKDWQLIRYDSWGYAYWMPADLIKATCFLDMSYFPFDIQECSMDFYVWGYSSEEVQIKLISDVIDTSFLIEHGSWKLLNASAKVENVTSTSRVKFTFRLERKSQYVMLTIILPILFLCLLDVLVFVLPTESGERVSYAITVLLSIAVFMTIVSDTLPKKSEPLPRISYFLMIDLIISSMICLCTILNLHVFHRKNDKPIPKCLRYFYNFLCCNYGNKIGDDSDEKNTKHNMNLFSPRGNKQENGSVKNDEIDKSLKSAYIKTPVHRMNSSVSLSMEKDITWQDVSRIFDYILFVVFFILTFTNFIIFLVITRQISS